MKKFMLIISIITFAVCNLFAQKDLETCRPQSSTYWTGRCDLYSKHNGEIKVGLATGNKFRGWSKFDISNIPDNAVINSIILKFWVNDPTTDNHYLIITKVSSNPVTASYSTLWNQIYNGTWYAEQYNCGLTTGYKEISLNNNAILEFEYNVNNGIDWFAVGFYELGEDAYRFHIDGWDWNGGSDPEPMLIVDYSLPTLPNLTADPDNCSLSVNGTVVDINVRVINNGQASAGSSHLAYYLSENTNITIEDWKIGDDYVNSLAPGEHDDEDIIVDVTTVTPTIPPGTYYVGFIVDYLDEVIESDESDNDWHWNNPQVFIPDPSYLTVSPTAKNVNSNSGNFQVTVSSNVNWTVSESCSWITCSPTSGSNNGTFTVSYQSNSSSSRTCIITVSGGGESATVTVFQQGPIFYLTVSPTAKNVNSNSGNFQVTVSSNVNNWTVSESCSWISCSPTSGSNNGTFTVSYQSNSSNSRTCIITVSGGGESATVTVFQQGPIFYLTVSPTAKNVNSDSGNFQVTVSSNVNNWTVSESCSWITCSPTSGSNNGTFTVSYQSNSSPNSRTYIITVSGGGESATVTVFQQGTSSYLTVSPTAKNVGSNSGNFQVTVSSNVNWTVSESCSWISCSPTSGSNNGSFTVNYSTNSSYTRTCTITVSGGGESATVIVTQQEQSYYLTVEPPELVIGGYAGDNSQFSINSNISWTISDYPSWLDISTVSGQNNKNITVTANSINETGSPKIAVLSISGSEVETKYVKVTQEDVTGINDNYFSKFIKIFPNPANDIIYIKTTETGLLIENLEILDVIGKSIYQSVLDNSNDLIRISVTDLQQGFYFIKLHTSKGVITKKIIIQR